MKFDETQPILVSELNYTGVSLLIDWLKSLIAIGTPRQVVEAEARQREWQKNKTRLERARERHAALEEEIEKWISRGGLKPGMRVKMRGCRDRSGVRDVLTVNRSEFRPWGETRIECRQIFPARKSIRGLLPESKGQITWHNADRIAGVFLDGKLVPIRAVLDAS